MQNKPLATRLLSKIKEVRAEHATNNNSIFSLQRQVSALYDLIELVISDENVTLSAGRGGQPNVGSPYQQHAGGGHMGSNPAGYGNVFQHQDRPPTVEEFETMEIPATQSTQVFMTARGTKVVPPAYLNMRPFTLQPGEPIPSFPSLDEYRANQGGPAPVNHPPGYQLNPSYSPGYAPVSSGWQGIAPQGYSPPPGFTLVPTGTPSNPTVQGQSPAGAPPGQQGTSMPAVGHATSQPIPPPPYMPVTSAPSVQLSGTGIPDSLSRMVQERGLLTDAALATAGGARNITNSDGSLPGQPQNMYPGGQVITG